jgi:hypothetical protein
VINGIMKLSETGMIANNHWLEIPEHFPFIQLDAHIILPNHIHGILIINQSANPNISTDAQIGRLYLYSESS